MKYHLVPLGCQMNQSDSERIASVLESLGYEATEDEASADLLGVVACSVRQKSIDRVYARIQKWNQWKQGRHLMTFVSGCVLPADHEKFLDRFDLVFGIPELPELPAMLARAGVTNPAAFAGRAAGLDQFWQIEARHQSRFEAYVPIQNGCNKFCTYCAVPYTRGREVSRPSAEILAEIESLVARGYRSITLLGQNVNSYGLDKAGREGAGELSFTELLSAVGAIGDRVAATNGQRFWVYFTSPHPRDMSPKLIETVARHDCLAKMIHLPLQSGDDGVLARMNRQHDLERYRGIVAQIRRLLPGASLFTDIITGFSGETEAEHQASLAALREFGFNMAYIAAYSPRPGAASAEWPDDIPLETKKQRLHELTEVFKASSLAWNQARLGQTLTALVEGPDKAAAWMQGRTEARVPIRFQPVDESLVGQFVEIRVTRVQNLSMEGTLVATLGDGSRRRPVADPQPAVPPRA